MAEQDIKQNNQRAQESRNPLERKDASPGVESKKVADELRNANKVQQNITQDTLNRIMGIPEARGSRSTTNQSNAPRQSRQQREHKTQHHKHNPHDSNAELREQLAIKTANIQRNTANSARPLAKGTAGTVADLRQDNQTEERDNSLQHSDITDTVKSTIEGSQPEGASRENRAQTSPESALQDTQLNPSAETIKLLDLVGPEAVLTFREKLQQVWVTLDANAIKDLDVIARMPATMTGMSAMELLMVESPQGIHFVAFLKNSNDFDVLATFDRRALLPDSPSRQLLEAALMSYEQMDAVFKEGSNKIESKVRELADKNGRHDEIFMQLQQLMVKEKRRRRKFRGMIDYLIDRLDEMDLDPESGENPFVPKELEKDLSGIGEGRLESELEEQEDYSAGVEPEDDDFH